MFSIKILVKKHQVNKQGTAPILLRVIKDRKKVYIRIGIYVEQDDWNFETQSVRQRASKAKSINSFINRKLIKAEDILIKLEQKGHYSLNQFKNEFLGISNHLVFDFFDEIINQLEKTSKGNALAYKNTKSVLLGFAKEDLIFAEIDLKFLNEFENHLRVNNCAKDGGVSFHMRTLRSLYNKAIKSEIANEDLYPFKNYKIKRVKTQKLALTDEQLLKVKNHPDSSKWHNIARDLFMFSFYTQGMNMVDIFNLKKNQVLNDRIEFNRRKNGRSYSIKVNDNIRSYFEKYDNETEYVFPLSHFSEHQYVTKKVNQKLKDILPNLKFYSARHTWASRALKLGVNVTIISDALGHEDLKTTQIYLASLGVQEMDDANKLVGDI